VYQPLSQYLLQFNRVTIPSVGTIQLVPQPAKLDIVNHLIHAPYYEATFSATDEVSQHQLEYFATGEYKDAESAYGFLKHFGEKLKFKIQSQPFSWNNVGTFEYKNQQIVFYPNGAETHLLPPVKAERVIRDKAQHAVLVGDQLVMSDEAGERLYETPRRRDYFNIIAWVLGVLALLFIVYYLYQHQFQSTASGLQRKVQPNAEAPTFK
jgi:hypothetical protein